MSKLKSLLLICLFSLFVNIAFSQLISVPFDNGFIGSIGANTQQANSTTSFTTLGISKSSFIQQTTNGIFYYTQGNDIGGKLRIYFTSAKNVTISGVTTSKSYIDIDGAIVWRGPGGGVGDYYGFLPNPNTNITFNYGVSSTYTISRSSNGSTGSNIGNLRVDKTLSLSNNESGNAAGVVDDLNDYLTTVRSLDPTGPVTVNSQTTTNQTPTITGTATLNAGETLSVTVNGVVYSIGDGNLSISGTTWTLVIPSSLVIATYSVEAIITNSSGFTLTDGTSDELVIYSPTLTVNGTLKTFSSCSGCSISPQSFSVSGSNLATNNLVVTAPTGVIVSTNSASGFASSVSLTPTSGTVTTTTIYVKLTDNSTSVSSGVISVTSIGATSKTITVTTNTDNALNFDGTNDYVLIPDNNALDLTTSFTIETWMYPTSNTGSQVVIGKIDAGGNASDLSYAFRYNNGALTLEIGNGTNSSNISTSSLQLNKWQHVAGVYNAGTMYIYIDGNLITSGSGGNSITSLKVSTSNLRLGSYNTTYGQYYKGGLDEVRIWNIVKTQSQIFATMYSKLVGNEAGLVAYYDFDNGIANESNSSLSGITTLENKAISTSSSINGTLTNFNLSGTSSNYVAGNIPSITAAGSATTVAAASTLQLSNGLTGGTWSSSNTSFATVSSSGLVTGVASGSVTITYAICDKTVSYALTVTQPTITTTGTLKTFTSCSGCTLNPQNFSVSGSNLGANITLTAPTGVVLSTTYSGTYGSSLSLTQSSGSVTTTTVYVKLSNNSTSISSGVISITSTGATSKTITVTVNTDNSLSLDGTGDKVTIADNNALDLTTNYTIEAWIKPNAFTWLGGIVSKYHTNSANGYILRLNSSGDYSGITFDEMSTSNGVLTLNKWYHIAAVNNNGTRKIYINGVEQVITGTPLTTAVNTDPVIIGQDFSSSGSRYFNGSIDEVRIWSTARSSTDITNNINATLSGTESGLVAYYNFNQGIANGTNTSLTTIEDYTSNALNGTIAGVTLTGNSSNFVDGFIPEITAAGNATTVAGGSTLSLSNGLTGGTWSSSNNSIATVNSSTGLVTGVAGGSLTITYSICGKTANFSLRVTVPTITTTGSLPVIASCSGCSVNPPSFTVSGSDLTNNIVLTAPTGVVISTTSTGTYSTSITLTQSSGSVTNTSIFVKLSNNATTNNSGVINITSTGATSKTMSVTVNTDNALNFDGVDDYVILDNVGSNANFGFTGTANFTLEGWVNRKATGADAIIVSKFNGGVAGNYALYITAAGYPYFSREASPWGVSSTSILPENEWHHIAGVFDGNTMKIYVDGVLNNSINASNSVTTSVTSIKVLIGANNINSISSSFFKGNLDEIRVWNVARTATQIQDNYFSELAGNETGLVAYYNFNQGVINGSNTSITTLTDKGNNNITGTLTNIARTGTTSNFVPGFIPSITGTATANVGASSTLSNTLTGGTWSSANTSIATVNSSTGVVTGVAVGTSTITYTICDKTVNTVFTVTVPTISTTGTLTAFNTCATTNSAAQTFTVSAQNLTANLVLTAPSGYEISTTSGGTYSTTISITPSSGTVSARLIYVRTTTSAVNGQSGNIVITSTGATTRNIATGNAVITQNKTASVTITSNATNNTICSGTSITFTANATNGGLTPTYQWYKDNVAISGATGSTYTTSTLSSNATITVAMVSSISSCLSGSPATSNAINVIVNSVPNNPGAISGATTICMNSNQVYSISAVTGATSYTWVVTGSLSVSASSTTNVLNITAANSAGSGTITVYANNACGTSVSSSSINVTVSNTPAPTASFTVTGNSVCLTNAGVTFTSNSTLGTTNSPIGTYSWTFGDGNTASTSTASNTYLSSGTFDAILTIQDGNQCSSSYSSRITVSPVSVAGIASVANATICEGSNTSLSLSGSTGTIQWQSSTDGSTWNNISGAISANYTTANLTATTYYRAVVTSGACSSATSGVVTVTVSPIPTATLASVTNLFTTSTSFDLGYSNAVGSPDEYSITAVAPNAMPNFTNISNYGLLGSPITVTIPASTSGTYNFNLTLRNNTVGCTSANIPFTVSVAVEPPSSLSYTTPNVYTVGTTISALNPTSTGGAITQYTIGPSLPAGLTIYPTTGVISGTPTAASSQTSYTVTGTNSSGTVTATVVITVNVAPPSSLSYTTPNVYTVGTAISALNPTSTGGAITQYTIGPSLPAGLTINPTTGVISGTPTAASSQTSYTVTGTNASGTVTATVVITVNVAAPASLSYNTPNVYTLGGGAITALNPTTTGGTITQYTIGPSLPAGLSINPTTGVISGTPTAASGQTTYTVTGTNSTGSVTATLLITVNAVQNNTLPQGGINAVDYRLFASDTVKLKVDISAGTSPFTVIISNNKTTVKDTVSSVTNGAILNLKSTSSNTIYTLFKITDNGGFVRSSGFTKDTTSVTIVAPNIALTLKADKAVKQADNSFKTTLLLKIKNSGQLDLKNVQVNANLSEVFPKDLTYILDSVKVVNGNIRLSSNYQGNGTSTTASSVKKGITASAGIISNAVLDANYLFANGTNLATNEEATVNFYLSIAPTTTNVVLKLQFNSVGDGILPKSGGFISQQSSTASSDDGTTLDAHPNITSVGTPLPTYLPLFPVEIIGAALKASNPTAVSGGYTFDFVAKAKNFSNMNLDTVAIFNDFRKTFTNPDTAYIIGTPVVTGNALFNINFNGYSDTLLIDSTAQLAVGDSITVSYKLFVGTTKTSASWSNAIYASGHSVIDYQYVWDISTDGTNPDPNGNGDTKEQGKTYFYVNFTPPPPPKVENKIYVFGTPIPSTIENLVKEKPVGTIPVWCDVQTAICSPNAPATPTIIGKYYYQLKSYDTTTKLYSIAYVNDTVIIKPPIPIVNDSTYIIGVANNPLNASVQVKAMTGGTLKYFLKTILLNAVPSLGNAPGTVRYTVSQVVNQIESDTASFKVTLLHPNDVMHLQKIAGEAVLQSNSSFNIPFTFIARNVLNKQLDSVLISDNLMNSIASPGTFSVISLGGTGGLITNTNFNGKTDINVTTYASKLIANAIDTIKLVINVMPNGYSGVLQNTAIMNAKTPYGKLSMNSSSKAWSSSDITKMSTPFTIPDLRIDIPEGFSPNRDGINDRFVIIKPYGTILELEVFNRWGNIVYTNPNYNNEWDGRGTNNFLGQDLLDGGYYYTLKAKSANGNVQIFKGFVLIQR